MQHMKIKGYFEYVAKWRQEVETLNTQMQLEEDLVFDQLQQVPRKVSRR